jgi:signal transduction histidine kinase
MRIRLLIAFVLIILIATGVTWAFALQTTSDEFSLLVTESNRRDANNLLPLLRQLYQRQGSWEAVQSAYNETEADILANNEAFANVVERSPGAANPPLPGVRPGQSPLNPNRPGQAPGGQGNPPNRPENAGQGNPNRPNNQGQIRLNPPRDEREAWQQVYQEYLAADLVAPGTAEALVFEVHLREQRVLVVDNSGEVAVDTAGELVGESLPDELSEQGVSLHSFNEEIGTLIVTTSGGVYSSEEDSFLSAVREGLMTGGLLSLGIGLFLALAIAYTVARPLRRLMAATGQIRAGEWGVTVPEKGSGEVRQLSAAFNAMSRHLAEERQRRAQLVNDVAHEVNTPLTLMQLELQGMQDGLQSPAEAAQNIQHELGELGDLVKNLVFLATQDLREAEPDEPVDINETVAHILKRYQGVRLPVQMDYQPSTDDVRVTGKPELIGRAVSNLVSNALRYTPEGGRVTVSTGRANGQVRVTVQDTGIGIPPEHVGRIFERFYRVEQSRSRAKGGRGLGLAIVQQIMAEHGGRVEVVSHEGEGSTFTLLFPAE